MKVAFSAFLLAMVLTGCDGAKQPNVESKNGVSEVPGWVNELFTNAPGFVFLGIGRAKTESDGESILLAEDRARADIAGQLESRIESYNTKYNVEGTSIIIEEDLSQMITSATLKHSMVIKRGKDNRSQWWCAVELKLNKGIPAIRPQMTEISDIIRYNKDNLPDTTNVSIVNEIPDWVLNPNPPEDAAFGIGAAKLDNIDEAVYTAMARARRSLARSLSADVSSVVIDLSYSNEDDSYQEYFDSITSVYDNTAMQLEVINIAKTKDGTLWIMLGCPVVPVEIDWSEETNLRIPPEEAFRRMDEAFEKMQMESNND
jgi:hypothetical protein